jgi:hypothetical protein
MDREETPRFDAAEFATDLDRIRLDLARLQAEREAELVRLAKRIADRREHEDDAQRPGRAAT